MWFFRRRSSELELEQGTTYTLVRRLGAGGMGSVYEALQHGAHGFTKRVAVKLIHKSVAANPEFLENFVGEAKLVAQLVHSNIVQTYQLGTSRNGPFIAMEFLQGVDLMQLMQVQASRDSRIPVELAVFIASRVCRGLAYAHEKRGLQGEPLGIVHRDISSQNIMVSREGDVKITDFGMAKAINLMIDGEGEIIMGKWRYMSPEQASGGKTDPRSDIFSLGVVLSEMLAGINIFAAEHSTEERKRVRELELPNFCEFSKEIDPGLNAILMRMLARRPEDRYGSAAELLVELEKYIYARGYGPTSETLARYMLEHTPQPVNTGSREFTTVLLKGDVEK